MGWKKLTAVDRWKTCYLPYKCHTQRNRVLLEWLVLMAHTIGAILHVLICQSIEKIPDLQEKHTILRGRLTVFIGA